MTGPEHYREAEQLLEAAMVDPEERDYEAPSAEVLAAAQVHATLALAAALGQSGDDPAEGGERS